MPAAEPGDLENLHRKTGSGLAAAGPSSADKNVMQTGKVVQFEEEIDTTEGRKHFVVSKAPLHNHEGTLIGICAVAVDVTPLKQAESEVRLLNQTLEKRVEQRTAELAQVNTQLQDANDQLEAFSYTVAHDLRAPLRGIQGFADAVVEDYAATLDQIGRDYLHRISRAAARMERLIEDLLSFNRLSRMELGVGTVDLDELLGDVMTNLRVQIEETGTRVDVAQRLPAVRANRAACVHIFQNLLSNAIKFARPGAQPYVRIWAETSSAGQGGKSFVRT
jgi:light-regulated signal transduction histidine kinase (bacteriophytochrome)